MVVTMAGMQEARRVAGDGAPRLIAAMTAAFALGQLLGPVVAVSACVAAPTRFTVAEHRRRRALLAAAAPALHVAPPMPLPAHDTRNPDMSNT